MLVEHDPTTKIDLAQSHHRDIVLTRIRLRSRRRILWMKSQPNQLRAEDFVGLAISPATIERILEDSVEAAPKEEIFYESDDAARDLCDRIAAADLAFSTDPAWTHFRQQFALSDFEIDLLSLCVAAGADPSLLRVYAYLQDDASAGYVTPWLAGCLFRNFPLAPLTPESLLVRWHLARPAEHLPNPWVANAPWIIDPHIMLWLSGFPSTDPVLGSAVQFISKDQSQAKLCLYPEQLTEMMEVFSAVSAMGPGSTGRSDSIEIELIAPEGAGKRTLAAQFAAALGVDLMVADADTLLGPDVVSTTAAERGLHALRLARLMPSLLYWRNTERVSARLPLAADAGFRIMLCGGAVPASAAGKSATARWTVRFPHLKAETKKSFWRELSTEPAPPLLAEWTLTPGEIVRAAQIAPAGEQAVVESVQQSFALFPSELFSPLVCPFDWDDIVLASHVREHLAELEGQVRLRWAVYEDWGFERLCPMGRGITALFSGPSGTGKTMAAQVLARSLGMKLLRVDLAGVMNKYIGETEKRLKQVFDACERANVLLFFDEADALFGQRTQVKDAHDRFANIEIDYLLQRMEQFDGVAVLATNRKSDLDKAFVRRIRFMVEFAPPGPSERESLWRRALRANSPRGEKLLDDIDFDALAQKLNMTGAEIASAALSAAFLARSEQAHIAMRHVLHAARREMGKQGIVMRVGEWES